MAGEGKGFGSVVNNLIENLEGFATAKTTVGEPIRVDDAIIVPLVDVSIGVGAGAALNQDKKRDREAGGMGAKLSPTAILLIKDGSTRIINIKDQNAAMKAMDLIPEIVNRFTGKTKVKEESLAKEIKKAAKEIKK